VTFTSAAPRRFVMNAAATALLSAAPQSRGAGRTPAGSAASEQRRSQREQATCSIEVRAVISPRRRRSRKLNANL